MSVSREKTVEANRRPEVVRLPVVVEQEIGELVYDVNGTRSVLGAGLVVIADFVNEGEKLRIPRTVPLKFSFDTGDGGRFKVTIDADS